MVPFKQIVAVARSRGINEKSLAASLGINARHVWRLKHGRHRPNPDLVVRAAKLLGIPTGDLLDSDPTWVTIAKDDLAQLAVYNEQLRKAESVLTVSGSIESYLQDDSMLEFSNRDWLKIQNWKTHCEFLLPYAKQQREARSRGDFLHRVVCPWRLFAAARATCIDWLKAIRFGLGEHEEVCAVAPVRDWEGFREAVDLALPSAASGWGKICVIDSVRVVIHVNDRHYLSTAHEATAASWKAVLERIVRRFEPTFLAERDLTPSELRSAGLATQDRIEDLLRTKEHLERANPYLVLFATMLIRKQLSSPDKIRKAGRSCFGPDRVESVET